jgi:CxxC motif-containing protein (DUF1111 family)
MSIIKILCCLLIAGYLLAACEKTFPPAPEDFDLLDGPIEGLTGEQQQRFVAGDIAFNDQVFTSATGLGPLFVSSSCGSCHAGDGKGHPSTALTRFGQHDDTGNQFLHLGGPQLQHRALPGFAPEQIPAGAGFAKMLPPANTGLGFLELVPDADLLAMSDPDDIDGDGISGRPNWKAIPHYAIPRPDAIEQNGQYITRFGKKAATYDLLEQTAKAYNQDIGIVSSFEPFDTYSGLEFHPEVSNQTIHDVVFYLRTLKAPIPREASAPMVSAGKILFEQIGCAKCHVPTLRTGASSIEPLAFREFHPYTDLLLHDMGPGLDDGYTEGSATTFEWRTPALWGLGLSKASQGGQYYLIHDGRAQSIEAAILMHGGESSQSHAAFQVLDATQKAELITFLESL